MSYMYIKALAAQQGCKTLTVVFLNIKHETINWTLKIYKDESKSELSEFFKLHSVLKFTTSWG